jgi:hypothetical protein
MLKRTGPLKRGTETLKRSPLKRKRKTEAVRKQEQTDIARMFGLYTEHWDSKEKVCASCGDPIYGECKSLYHHHLLEKGLSRYEHLKYEIENLMMLCEPCHTDVNSGYPSQRVIEETNKAHKKFNV